MIIGKQFNQSIPSLRAITNNAAVNDPLFVSCEHYACLAPTEDTIQGVYKVLG